MSTTNRARCFSGSHSSTDGGIRKPVSRSTGRKLLMQRKLRGRKEATSNPRFYPRSIRGVKSDTLLAPSSKTAVFRILARLWPHHDRQRCLDVAGLARRHAKDLPNRPQPAQHGRSTEGVSIISIPGEPRDASFCLISSRQRKHWWNTPGSALPRQRIEDRDRYAPRWTHRPSFQRMTIRVDVLADTFAEPQSHRTRRLRPAPESSSTSAAGYVPTGGRGPPPPPGRRK